MITEYEINTIRKIDSYRTILASMDGRPYREITASGEIRARSRNNINKSMTLVIDGDIRQLGSLFPPGKWKSVAPHKFALSTLENLHRKGLIELHIYYKNRKSRTGFGIPAKYLSEITIMIRPDFDMQLERIEAMESGKTRSMTYKQARRRARHIFHSKYGKERVYIVSTDGKNPSYRAVPGSRMKGYGEQYPNIVGVME